MRKILFWIGCLFFWGFGFMFLIFFYFRFMRKDLTTEMRIYEIYTISSVIIGSILISLNYSDRDKK